MKKRLDERYATDLTKVQVGHLIRVERTFQALAFVQGLLSSIKMAVGLLRCEKDQNEHLSTHQLSKQMLT